MRWWPFSKTYRIKCPQGHEAIVFKSIDDAMPLAIKSNQTVAGLKVAAEQLGHGNLDVKHSSVVEGLLFAIDSRNNSQILDFRNAYLAYMSNPCGNGGVLERTTERIMGGRERLEASVLQAQTFVNALKAAPANATDIIAQFGPLLQNFNVASAIPANAAIADAREDAKRMGGEHG